MSKSQTKKRNEQKYIDTCMRRLKKNQRQTIENSDKFDSWYDYHSRTNEIIVPSKWVDRLEEANAVDNELQYIREKLDQDFAKQAENKVDREALYCSSALHKMRQNQFYQRLQEHQMRWQPISLIGELASSLPKPTTDPKEIEKQLFAFFFILKLIQNASSSINKNRYKSR